MNREQLRSVLQRQLRAASTEVRSLEGLRSSKVDHERTRSLADVVRSVQAELEDAKAELPSPGLPRPSAEQLAAFSHGNTTPDEDAEIVAACLHDPSILLQLLIAERGLLRSESDVGSVAGESAVDPLLRERLLALRRPHAGLSITGQQPDSVSESYVASNDPLEVTSLDPPTVSTSSQQGYRSVWWAVCGALAASLLWGVGWWWLHSNSDRPKEGQPLVVQNDPQERSPESMEGPSRLPTDTIPPRAIADDDRSGPLSPSMEYEAPIRPGPATSPQRDTFGPSPRISDSPRRSLADNDPVFNPETMNQAAPKDSLTGVDPSQPLIVWTQIVGLVAEQLEPGYDRWQPVSETRGAGRETDPVSRASGEPAHWLMLPGCYARGVTSLGAELVLAEQTRVLVDASDGEFRIDLQDGSVAVRGLPAGSRLTLRGGQSSGAQLIVHQAANVHCWIESASLFLSVSEGQVEVEQRSITPHFKHQIAEGVVQNMSIDAEQPAWCETLPTDLILSRSVLANIRRSADLEAGLDLALQSIATNNRLVSSRRLLSDFEVLSRWRTGLAVEDPLAPALHPLWPVRYRQLELLISPRDGTSFDRARRHFAGRMVAPPTNRLAVWQALLQGRQVPGRVEFAEWLNFLEGDDPLIAAVGDFLLRRFVGTGPAFDPRAPLQTRSVARRQWTQAITASMSSRPTRP